MTKWEMLAAWLKAQWQEEDGDETAEAYATCAQVIAECPAEWTAEQKLERLFEVLHGALMRTESPEEDDE